MNRYLIIFVLLLSFSSLFAQRNCGTQFYNSQIVTGFPELLGRYGRIETDSSKLTGLNRVVGVIRIPIVVHVVYNNTEENLSDRVIQSQIDILNEDYSAKNVDLTMVPIQFKDKIADCEIQFDLKEITRTKAGRQKFLINLDYDDHGQQIYKPKHEPIKFTSQGGNDGYSCTEYLNIWVGNITDGSKYQLLGYAAFPGGLCEYDGVVVHYKYFGSIDATAPFDKGRTLTHEVGHWLNLRHIWGDAECGDDMIDDTPPQESPHSGCPGFPSLSCQNKPDGAMYMNYMDYVNDACMVMFTKRQKDRMRSLFLEGGERSYFLKTEQQNSGIFKMDQSRNDRHTPVINDFVKYYRCRPVHDTCRFAYVIWDKDDSVKEYIVQARKMKSDKWEKLVTTNNYVRMKGLNSHVLYEVKVKAALKNNTFSEDSIPYIFTLKGFKLVSFSRLKLMY